MGCGSSRNEPPSKPRTPPSPPRTSSAPPRTASPISNTAVIQVDKGLDEVVLSSAEDEAYPGTGPPQQGEVDKGATTDWFDSDWIQGGPNAVMDEDTLFLQNLASDNLEDSDEEQVPDPKPIVNRRRLAISYTKVDEHAVKATEEDSASFETLTSYLSEAIQPNDRFPERLKARAIIKWLSEQNVDSHDYGSVSTDTPTGLLQYIKEKRMTYATCYAILCRKAGLKCVVVTGVVKAAEYQPGDMDTDDRLTKWTAVHVDGSWQIIHAYWVCRALYGHSLGGWTKVESDGKRVVHAQKAAKGVIKSAFQENFFMPYPPDFVHMCCADEHQWQLLPTQDIVSTRTDFMKLPFLLPTFFGLQLKLISEQHCVIDSQDGTCTIRIKGNADNVHQLNLQYDLYAKNTDHGDNPMIQAKNITRLVLQSRSDDIFTFQVRFPIEGEFKLILFGGPHDSPMMSICEFKLVCKKPLYKCRLLPKQAGVEGWGPGPSAEISGLFLPTKISGIVPVSLKSTTNTSSTEKFQFHVSPGQIDKCSYRTELIQDSDFEGEIEHVRKFPVECKTVHVDERNTILDISTTIDQPGEYALVIVRSSVENHQETVACNYLLSTYVQRPRLKTNKRIAKANLSNILISNANGRLEDKIKTLENGIKKCRHEKIEETDEDLVAGVTKLDFLNQKREIEDSILRRNLGVTERTLRGLVNCRFLNLFSVDVVRLNKLKQELKALQGFPVPMPSLRCSIREAHCLPNPTLEVIQVVRALLLLLGYDEDFEEDWRYMQTDLNGSGILFHINNLKPEDIDESRRLRVKDLISKFGDDRMRHVNQTAARLLRVVKEKLAYADESSAST